MGKKQGAKRDLVVEFQQMAARQGKTYAQAQTEETLQLIREGRMKKRRR